MFFAVYFPEISENRVVKANWIKSLPVLNMIKKSINRNILHLIFWSNDPSDEADFSLPKGDENSDRACFEGFLLKSFGEY